MTSRWAGQDFNLFCVRGGTSFPLHVQLDSRVGGGSGRRWGEEKPSLRWWLNLLKQTGSDPRLGRSTCTGRLSRSERRPTDSEAVRVSRRLPPPSPRRWHFSSIATRAGYLTELAAATLSRVFALFLLPTARHRRVSQGKPPLCSTFSPGGETSDPVCKYDSCGVGSLLITSSAKKFGRCARKLWLRCF